MAADPRLAAALPILAGLDFPEQRLVAAGALRAAEILELTPARLAAALRLTDPRPLDGETLVTLDRWAREERDPLERDLAGRRWPILASPSVVRNRQRDLGKKLARIDQRLADRLYAGAVTTMREALKRAGIKAKVRARNRGNEAKEQLDLVGMTDPVLAAINVRADELLDRSFEAYGTDALDWVKSANRDRRKAIARSWDIDERDLDDHNGDHRAELAVALLVGLLLGRARGALAHTIPGKEPTVSVPFQVVRTAMRVREGAQPTSDAKGVHIVAPKQSETEGLMRQAAERATPLPDLEALAAGVDVPVDLEGVVPTLVQHFEWVHGYFGEPASPFEPHLMLDGAEYTEETRDFVLAKDPNEWPEGNSIWSVDDHDSCTCYEIVTWEPAGAGDGA